MAYPSWHSCTSDKHEACCLACEDTIHAHSDICMVAAQQLELSNLEAFSPRSLDYLL